MKYLTIHHGGNKIDIHNSFLGKETIKVNDEVVSSKYSFRGSEHNFKLSSKGGESEGKVAIGFGNSGTVISFYVNGEPIIEGPKGGYMVILTTSFVAIIVVLLLKAIF